MNSLKQLEEIANELIESEDLVVREAGRKIKAILYYLKTYYEPQMYYEPPS
jgi:hypothetical protein